MVLGPGMTRLVDGGPGHKNRLGEYLETGSLAHQLVSAAFSIPGKDKPSRGSASPQVDVQTQVETLAVPFLGYLQPLSDQGLWKNPRGILHLREKASSCIPVCH